MSAPPSATRARFHRWIDIDTGRLTSNARLLSSQAGAPRRVLAVIKSDAYGHGAVESARALAAGGVTGFAVFLVEEAQTLRAGGVREPLLLLGPIPPGRASEALSAGVLPTVHSLESADVLAAEAARSGSTVAYHLKVDTGMGRLGVPPDQLSGFLEEIRSRNGLRMEGLYSHLACAEDPDHPLTAQQIARFGEAVESVRAAGHSPGMIHLANSAATLTGATDFDTVRPGLALFGYLPAPAGVPDPGLRPALSLRARVVQRKTVRRGATLGYGATWTAARDSTIATIPIGYEEGYPRALGNRAEALVRGRRVPVVGRVSMNLTTLDVTDVPGVETGDVVTVLGEDGRERIDAWELARHAGIVVWEILCGLDRSLPRFQHVDGEAAAGQ